MMFTFSAIILVSWGWGVGQSTQAQFKKKGNLFFDVAIT